MIEYRLERHAEGKAKLAGVEGIARIVAENEAAIVLAFPGYAYNPGSRHSGLRSYTNAETVTYTKHGEDQFGRLILRALIAWKTRR